MTTPREIKRAARATAVRKYNHTPGAKERRRLYSRRPDVRKRHEVRKRLSRTGVSAEMFADLLEIQGGKCGCCGIILTKPHADHDHEVKRPRGLLCQPCNMAEGQIKKSGLSPRDFAERLQHYLDNPPARIAELL